MSNLSDIITKIMSSHNESYTSGFLDAEFGSISKQELLSFVEKSDSLTGVACVELTNAMNQIFQFISKINNKSITIKTKPDTKLLTSFIDSGDVMFEVCKEILKVAVKVSCILKKDALKKEPVKITSQPCPTVAVAPEPVTIVSRQKMSDVVSGPQKVSTTRTTLMFEKTAFSMDIKSQDAPVKPVVPVKPVEPAKPAKPSEPVMPVKPVKPESKQALIFRSPQLTQPGKIDDEVLFIDVFHIGSSRINAGRPVLSAEYIDSLFANVNIDEYKNKELNFINNQRQLGGYFIEVVPDKYSPIAIGKNFDFDKELYKFVYVGKTYYSIDNPEYLANATVSRNPGFLIEFSDKFIFYRVLKLGHKVYISETAHKMGIALAAIPNYILKRVCELERKQPGYISQLIKQIANAFEAGDYDMQKFGYFAENFIRYTRF